MAENDFTPVLGSQQADPYASTNASLPRKSIFHRPGLNLRSRKGKGIIGKVILIPVIVLIAGLAVLFTLASLKNTNIKKQPAVLAAASDQRVSLPQPVSHQALNSPFTFPLKDQNGKVLSNLNYDIQDAELRNVIVIKGTKATAVQGRTFLVINLKITNNYEKSVQINARDYIRLIINKNDEKLAPDIHNDPVEVQAISTKYTSVGFPINDTFKSLVLQVGEITGKKELITLNLKMK